MKKTILILTFVFLHAAFIFAQETTIDREKFNQARESAAKKLDGKTYRETTVFEIFTDRSSAPTQKRKTTIETIPPDREYVIFETEQGKKEVIEIKGTRYVRLNGGEWTQEELTGIGMGNGIGCASRVKSESYKVIENSNLNGKTADFYEMKKTLTDCLDNASDEIWLYRFWIGKDGLFLKTENEYGTMGGSSIQRTTIVYEYDSKIRIEAPIVNKTKQ
jgi:hypothetical protein